MQKGFVYRAIEKFVLLQGSGCQYDDEIIYFDAGTITILIEIFPSKCKNYATYMIFLTPEGFCWECVYCETQASLPKLKAI